jgi:hypothetical protein
MDCHSKYTMFLNLILFLKTFLFISSSIHGAIIKNANTPSCKNCIHYNPSFYFDYSSDLNRCKYFGTKNILTDDIDYEFASMCRDDESKCGLAGKYFEKEVNVDFKIAMHSFMKNSPFSLTFFILLVNAYIRLLNDK